MPEIDASGKSAPTARIVVGVDGSATSKAALRWAIDQAKRTGSRVDVVMSWEYPTSFGWDMPYPADLDLAGDAKKGLDEVLDEVAGPNPGVELRAVVVEGHPAPTLLAEAEGASLLVLGSRGHGGFAGLLLGSVSQHCAAHSTCPVVIIPAKG